MRRRHDGRGPSTEPWIGYPLDEKLYRNLLHLVQGDESLWGFLQDKLRYRWDSVGTEMMLADIESR
jgi:hypothetical protein